ncbi:MAG: hypothetical protein K0Q99_541 [Clostridia bacterium]|nr:hypothetical protein [Clostridia bacterium]
MIAVVINIDLFILPQLHEKNQELASIFYQLHVYSIHHAYL